MYIKNDYLKLEIQARGGSMTSIYDLKREKELLYQPLADSWKGQDIFIFPFIARLIDKTYTYKDKTYQLENHGLLRYMDASLTKLSDTSMEASFSSTDETLTRYPFKFKASLIYSLDENKINLAYEIRNESQEDMPFMLGAHPAFKIPGERNEKEFNMTGNYISFEEDSEKTILLQEETCSYMTGRNALISSPIKLSKGLFNMINTIIIDASNTDKVFLNKKDGSKITVSINNAPYLALWSDKKYGDYVCIEPWYGYPDTLGSSKDIIKKPGINILKPGSIFTASYSIEID